MSLVRVVARPLLAAPFVASGVSRLRAPESTASSLRPVLSRAAKVIPALRTVADRPQLVARVLGGVQVGAGALLAAGRTPRLSSALIVLSQTLTVASDALGRDEAVGQKASRLTTQLGLTGGALLASVDTNGKPSLAWRAKDAGKRGRRAIRQETAAVARAAKKATA